MMIRSRCFGTFALSIALATVVLATVMTTLPAWAAPSVFVTDVRPDGGTSSVAVDSDVTAKFSKAMKMSTVNGSTFYLTREGSSTAVPAAVSYNRTSKTATLNPASSLESGTTYTATIRGGRSGIRASDGGKLGGSRDGTATLASGKVTWSFATVDNDPPPPPPPPAVTVTPATVDLSFSGDCSLIPFIIPYPNDWVTTTNNGPDDVTFAAARITGPDASHFSAGSVQYFANPANQPITIVPNDFLQDQVALHPDPALENGTRTYTATLTYFEDGTGAEIARVDLTATTRCARLVFP